MMIIGWRGGGRDRKYQVLSGIAKIPTEIMRVAINNQQEVKQMNVTQTTLQGEK
jgi:hypothetical protein